MNTDKKALAISLLEIMQIHPALHTVAMAEEGIDLIVGECVEAMKSMECRDNEGDAVVYVEDATKALQNIIKPKCQICGSTDLWDGRFCAACAETHYVG